jgi:hypothetical protein
MKSEALHYGGIAAGMAPDVDRLKDNMKYYRDMA